MLKQNPELLLVTKRIILFYVILLTIISQLDLASRLPSYITDFCQDYVAAQNLIKSESIYKRNECWSGTGAIKAYTTPHPPFSIVLLVPFAYLSLPQAMIAWLIASWVFYASACIIVLKIFDKLKTQSLIITLFISLFYSPFREGISTQNIIQLLLLLLTLAWYMQLTKRDAAAGVFIGLAILLRIWPVLFAFPAIIAKKTNFLIGLIATVTIGTLITLAFGIREDYFFYLGPVLKSEEIFILSANNSSLLGLVAKIFYNAGYKLDEAIKYSKASGVILAFLSLGLIHFISFKKISEEKIYMLAQSLCLSLLIFIFPLVWGWALLIYLFCFIVNLYIIRGLPKLPKKWWSVFVVSIFFLFLLKIYIPDMPIGNARLIREQYLRTIDFHSLISIIGAALFFISQFWLYKFIHKKQARVS